MADFDFVNTSSEDIYTAVIGALMDSCSEPLYPGDERRIFGEGIVALFLALYSEFDDRAKQRTLQYARGYVLDALGKRYDLTRAAPAHATATFRFSLDAAQTSSVVIPAGTRVTTDGSVYFATQSIAIIAVGNTYIDVIGECTEGGSAYNGFAAGAINVLVDLIPYVIGAENTTITSGGDDGEPYTEAGDNHFRTRIQLAPSTQTTAGPEDSYKFLALSADPDIIDVAIDCPAALPNTVNVYPLMTGGKLPDDDTLSAVETALSASTVRPMTDHVVAVAPTQEEYSISLTYYCSLADEAAVIETIEGDGGAIDQYIAWQCGALGRDINPDYLLKLMLAPTYGTGATRVIITSPTYAELAKSKVAKLSGTPTVTHVAT